MAGLRQGLSIVRSAVPCLLVAALAACATANIQPSDLNALGPAPTAEEVGKVAHGSALYRLDYLAGGHTYIYETFEASDTERYYGLLFQDGKLAAVDLTDSRTAKWPELRACTVFPPDPAQDVDSCFQKFNQSALTSAVKLISDVAPDEAAKERSPGVGVTAVQATAYVVLDAPVVIGVVFIALPVLGVAELTHRAEGKPVNVTLGEPYGDIRSRVETYPAKFLSITYGRGTVLVPGPGISEVSSAFGVFDDKVIWVDRAPRAGCGGELFGNGTRCTMVGITASYARHVPGRPRPPVMDHWQNLAVYDTAPPRFDVLGETVGDPSGLTAKGRMESAIEDMKKVGIQDGATAVLVYPPDYPWGEGLPASPPPGNGAPIYGDVGEAPLLGNKIRGLEIYVPADAAAFQKAAALHASECDGLSKQKDAAKEALDAAKDAGTPDDVSSAKAKLQAAEGAEDAAFCDDDDWYAEQMTKQKH